MKLIKEWREGGLIPQGLSYRLFNGKSVIRNGIYLTVLRLSLQVEWHKYKRVVYLHASPGNRPAYTLDFRVALL